MAKPKNTDKGIFGDISKKFGKKNKDKEEKGKKGKKGKEQILHFVLEGFMRPIRALLMGPPGGGKVAVLTKKIMKSHATRASMGRKASLSKQEGCEKVTFQGLQVGEDTIPETTGATRS